MAMSGAERVRNHRERKAAEEETSELLEHMDTRLSELERRVAELEEFDDEVAGINIDGGGVEITPSGEDEPPEDWDGWDALADHQLAKSEPDEDVKLPPGDDPASEYDEEDGEPESSELPSITDLRPGSPERRARAKAMIRLAEMDELDRVQYLISDPDLAVQYADYLTAVAELEKEQD